MNNTMQHHHLTLRAMLGTLAICRLDADAPIPDWASGAGFVSITRTADELSIVIAEERVPDDVRCERDWKALKVDGPLGFSLVGVLVSICRPLTDAGISVFAISTFDTDYVIVKHAHWARALGVLCRHHFVNI